VREIKWDAFRKYSEDRLEAEQQRAEELELQVAALKQQLQEAEIHYKQKVFFSLRFPFLGSVLIHLFPVGSNRDCGCVPKII
jgi:hypothetical protein